MSKIFAVSYMSLDGVMEAPAWSGPYFNEELAQFQHDNMFGCDALLLGRVTYEGFAAAWPNMVEEEGEGAVRMNSMPKYVATTTLTEPQWNAEFITGDTAEEVAKLKAMPDNDMMVAGSGKFLAYLSEHGLVDEYRIMVFPVVVGAGQKLFGEGWPQQSLSLAKSQITSNGVAILTYVPAQAA